MKSLLIRDTCVSLQESCWWVTLILITVDFDHCGLFLVNGKTRWFCCLSICTNCWRVSRILITWDHWQMTISIASCHKSNVHFNSPCSSLAAVFIHRWIIKRAYQPCLFLNDPPLATCIFDKRETNRTLSSRQVIFKTYKVLIQVKKKNFPPTLLVREEVSNEDYFSEISLTNKLAGTRKTLWTVINLFSCVVSKHSSWILFL